MKTIAEKPAKPRPIGSRWTLADPAVAAWACFILFLIITVDVYWHGPLSRLDSSFTQFLYRHRVADTRWLDWITAAGDGTPLGRAMWIVCGLLLICGRWYQVPGFLICVLIGLKLNPHMQDFFGRVRPQFEDVIVPATFGYPSGHTTAATLFFGYVAGMVWEEIKQPLLKRVLVAAAFFIIAAVAVSRVLLFAHFTLDVVGAILSCASWVLFLLWLNKFCAKLALRNLENWIKNR